MLPDSFKKTVIIYLYERDFNLEEISQDAQRLSERYVDIMPS